MKNRLRVVALVALVSACAAPAPARPSTPPPTITTPADAIATAERLTSIAGPWVAGDVRQGTYAELWQGSTNDLSGTGTADRASTGPTVVWRVDLSGPSGVEELYIDARTGRLVDSITQGD